MQLLYWTVITVFSVSVASVVSESQVGGYRARIIVPSPTPDCWSPSCLTWSQCLADPAQCFTSHTTVTMLDGEYILHEYLEVYGVVSLSIYGNKSEVNGSARENQVVINCEYREGGIGITAVANVSLSGITMVYCGVLGVDRRLDDRDLVFVYFALHIQEGINVSLSFIFITNSTQIGLLCINLLGTSGIQDSVFTRSNYRLLEKYMQGETECSTDSWECRGTNVLVLFFNPLAIDIVRANIFGSNFIVERTNISYGVNLRPQDSWLSVSAGIVVHLHSGLDYDVRIVISKCNIMNNIDKTTANLYMAIGSNSTVLIADSNFTCANRLTEDGPLELVPVVYPNAGTLTLQVSDEYDDTAAINVEIVMNKLYIAENVGGGLLVNCLPQLPQSYIQMKLKNVEVVHNYLGRDNFQDKRRLYGFVVRFEKGAINAGGVYTSLESVEISNNVLVFENENTWNQQLFLDLETTCALTIMNIEVHFKQTKLFNNSMPAVLGYNSNLHFHGANVFKNNTGRQCGGALVLRMNSHIYLHRGTQVYILENTALKYGGGICVDGGSVPETFDVCFWQIADLDILYNNDTFVYLEGNIAPITGYAIYAGCVADCYTIIGNSRIRITSNRSRAIFSRVFRFKFPNITFSTWYQISSRPFKICFCYPGPELVCDETVVPSISVYPGQTFNISAIGMGIGISPAVVRSRISGKHNIFPELQSLGNACEPLNYTILAPENVSGIRVQLTVGGHYVNYGTIKNLNVTTLRCPLGFVLRGFKCECHQMLQTASVRCDINTQRFTRSGSVWIGMGSDEEGLLTHMHCPNAYCKLQETDLNLTSPDVQCAFGHSGVLCGSCESGLALMLGSSKCQYCSNIYLLLILPFLAVGVLLVIILGRVNLTVASGTMNGVIFYANVVKASSNALISNSVSRYFLILFAWLNLDLGIETCFFSHLDMFWKVFLQFAFPLYIWLLVAAIILLSRYSTVAARLSGSNSVPVLATLFLLSYAKVLATIIVAFSFTSLEAEKISPLVWLHDGNLRFLQGKHIALVVVSILFALFYIIPLTLLLLFAPVLRKAHNHRIVRLVQMLKPLLDAFQGPYKDRFHWWPGLMLVIRIILLIALTANTKYDPRLSALLVGVTALPLALLSYGGVYKNKLLNLHETALNTNMIVFVLWSFFNYSSYGSKAQFTKQQQATAYTMISIFYVLFMAVLVYHVSKKIADLGIPRYLFHLLKRQSETTNDVGETELRERQGSGCAPVPAQLPTVTFVELREPLLTD